MIAIAVAASILVYVWSMGLIGTLQSGGGEQTAEQVIMEAYDWTVPGTITLYLKNVGASDVFVDAIYIHGQQEWSTGVALPVLDTPATAVTVTVGGSVTPGVAYTIKIVSLTGGVFTYSCICGTAQ